MAGGQFPAASRHHENAGVARRQPVAGYAAGSAAVRSLHRHGLRGRALPGCLASSTGALDRLSALPGLLFVLLVAASSGQFLRDEPVAECPGSPGYRRVPFQHDLRGPALAESSAYTGYAHRRIRHVHVVRKRAQHPAADAGASDPRGSGVVGFPDGVAPLHARRARILFLRPKAVHLVTSSTHSKTSLPLHLVFAVQAKLSRGPTVLPSPYCLGATI